MSNGYDGEKAHDHSACGRTGAGRGDSAEAERMVEAVRERYGSIALSRGTCCSGPASGCASDDEAAALKLGYRTEDLDGAAAGANLGLGCGAPVALLELSRGETVLDLGAGGGFDVLLAAREVGPEGTVIGVDMTPEMVRLARDNASAAGAANVDIREGRLESLPVEPASVDAVTSNCVINLVPDKARVFREIARVLKPGGRLVISDVILDGELPEAIRDDVVAYSGCVAGAMEREAYLDALAAAGLGDVEIVAAEDAADLFGDSPEAVALLKKWGKTPSELRGVVTSITYRARKPRAT